MGALNEQAYQHLQELLLQEKLSAGTVYSESKLARELGISRTPFRDAVHRLAQEGYIDVVPSRGFILHQMTQKDIDETFQVRCALECYCTRQVTLAAETDKARKLFRELNDRMDRLKDILDTTQSIRDFCVYDFEFHTSVVDFVKNEKFSETFSLFKHRMRTLAEKSLAHEGRMCDTYQEHLAILRAMEAGDAERVYCATLKHLENPWKINLGDLMGPS